MSEKKIVAQKWDINKYEILEIQTCKFPFIYENK